MDRISRALSPIRRSYQCMQCKTISDVEEFHGLDLTRNPQGKAKLLEGEFFQWSCPKCGLKAEASYPCWYFDPERKLGVALVPDLDSSDAEDTLRTVNQNLEGLSLPGMVHRMAGSFYAMQELVRAQDAGLDHRVVQLVKPMIIGQLQSHGEVVWNGFFQGVSTPEPWEQEPLSGVLYASLDRDVPPPYGEPIYWYDIHLTNRNVIRAGVNQVLFQMCQEILERRGTPPDDGKFHLYDLNWAIRFHDQGQG